MSRQKGKALARSREPSRLLNGSDRPSRVKNNLSKQTVAEKHQ
jgi:hypothetical protein